MVRASTWAWIALSLFIGVSTSNAVDFDDASYYESDGDFCELDCGSCELDCGSCEPDNCCCPLWTVTVDALILSRTKAAPRVLYVDQLAQDAPALNVSDLGFSAAAGPRVNVIRHRECLDLEFTYFGIDGFGSQVLLGPGQTSQYSMNNLYGVNFGDIEGAEATYRSKLYNFEFNLRRQHNDCVTVLAGFRYIELDESFRLTDVFNGYEEFLTHSQNRLYGFQIGADARVLERGCFRLNASGEAGVYYNSTRQTSSYSFLGTEATAAGGHTSFVGELAFTGTYQMTECLSLRGGYQLMWIAGASLAAEQIDGTDLNSPATAALNSAGDVFYQGGFVGLEYVR